MIVAGRSGAPKRILPAQGGMLTRSAAHGAFTDSSFPSPNQRLSTSSSALFRSLMNGDGFRCRAVDRI